MTNASCRIVSSIQSPQTSFTNDYESILKKCKMHQLTVKRRFISTGHIYFLNLDLFKAS